uniref:Uncharacterized protein n=1 Tax=Rhizophora mucronata TaxID=61149 RepID=A0A2P2IHL4_RHIMU
MRFLVILITFALLHLIGT